MTGDTEPGCWATGGQREWLGEGQKGGEGGSWVRTYGSQTLTTYQDQQTMEGGNVALGGRWGSPTGLIQDEGSVGEGLRGLGGRF